MKKYIIVKKTIDNPMVDISIEHLIRFVASLDRRKYGVISTKNFIVARIPGYKGDVNGVDKFFDRVHMVYADESERPTFDEMKKVSDRVFDPDLGVGYPLITEALKVLMIDYDSVDEIKF